MDTTRIQPFGASLVGVDLRADRSDAVVEQVERLLHDDGFVLFRGQDLDDAGQIDFARRFGKFSRVNEEDVESFVYRINNREGFGRTSELAFHSDNTYTEFPLKYLMLYGLDVTTEGVPLRGGETMLVNAADALGRLAPDLVDRLASLECRIGTESRGSFVRPCIETHWATGKRYVTLNQLTHEIIGMDVEQSAPLLERVFRVLYDEAFVYRHRWREGDLLIWDNRLVQHGRSPYDNAQTRILRRSAVADDREPTAVAL